jgi:hypothetical protein
MDSQAVYIIKGILLTEALTHAVRSWGIFNPVRDRLTRRCDFLRRLLSCFECTAVWSAAGVFAYLYFLDFPAVTFIIIVARLATIGHIIIDLCDAWRASTINRI